MISYRCSDLLNRLDGCRVEAGGCRVEHQQLIYNKVKTVKHLIHYISAVGFSQQIPMIGLLHLGYKNTPLYDCMISPNKKNTFNVQFY